MSDGTGNLDNILTQRYRDALCELSLDAINCKSHRELLAALVLRLQSELTTNRNKTTPLMPEMELLVRVISSVVRSNNAGEPIDVHYVLDTMLTVRNVIEKMIQQKAKESASA